MSRFRSGSVRALSVAQLRTEPQERGWRIALPGGRALATPAVDGGDVYVGGGFGAREFYAIDAASGCPRWALALSDDGPSAAVVASGRVVFTTESCTLFVVDAESGELCWAHWLGDPLMAQPAVSDQRVYAAYPGPDGRHRLAAFALADGDTMWEAALDGDLISAPVVHEGFVYGTSFSGTVYKIDASTGVPAWARPMRATSAPWIAHKQVYVAQRAAGAAPVEGISSLSETGERVASMRAPSRAPYLDPRVQSQTEYSRVTHLDDTSVGFASAPASAKAHQASANVGHGNVRALWEFQGSRPTVVGGSVYTTQGNVVSALDRESDRVRWQARLPGDERAGGHVGTPPACAGGRLYLGTIAGEVSVLEAESGTVLGTHVVGAPLRSQPVVQRGRLFAATTAGTLVCIELNDESADGWPMWGGSAAHNGSLPTGK